MTVPFWEETYQDDTLFTFGSNPNPPIEQFWPLFQDRWRVLDVGCGDGKNALYFARHGFATDAFDLSENAIARVNRTAQKEQIKVNAWVRDLREFGFGQSYELILSFGTLHFVEKGQWKAFLNRAKEHTTVGGVHIIQIFTTQCPASPDIAPFAIGLADEGELAEQYQGWSVLENQSYVFEDEHPGVPKHMHASNRIVAQKVNE